MERWTSNSPLSSEVPLNIEYDPIQYGIPPDTLPDKKFGYTKNYNTKNKKWKQKLHGVTY